MTEKEKRIIIAEWCGWDKESVIDDFDLNIMHEAEKILIKKGGLQTYEHYLRLNEVEGENHWYGSLHATAEERVNAFVFTIVDEV